MVRVQLDAHTIGIEVEFYAEEQAVSVNAASTRSCNTVGCYLQVVITKVEPGSQAHQYEYLLSFARVISVNGVFIHTIGELEEQLHLCRCLSRSVDLFVNTNFAFDPTPVGGAPMRVCMTNSRSEFQMLRELSEGDMVSQDSDTEFVPATGRSDLLIEEDEILLARKVHGQNTTGRIAILSSCMLVRVT
jgi:hypothetical protein